MTAIITAVLGFVVKLFGQWLNRTPAIVPIAKEAGAAEQSAADSRAEAKAESKIAEAEAQVVTPAVVVDRLSKGTF